jgi:hypothetical protein
MPRHDEEGLIQYLDECIELKDSKRALDKLKEVRSTFSKYDEYMEKIGRLIK